MERKATKGSRYCLNSPSLSLSLIDEHVDWFSWLTPFDDSSVSVTVFTTGYPSVTS